MSADDPLSRVREIGAAIVDPWVVVGADRTVRAFNPAYRALFDRARARKLLGSACCEHLTLGVCQGGSHCLARRCLTEGHQRYDEIDGQLADEPEARTLIASAAPVPGDDGPVALMVLRDVSDAADVQRKYRHMLDEAARERARLEQAIGRRTKELKDAHMALNRLQQELVRFRKGLFG